MNRWLGTQKLSGVDRSAKTKQVRIKSPRIHMHTPPNPTYSRWYGHAWLKADYKPDSPHAISKSMVQTLRQPPLSATTRLRVSEDNRKVSLLFIILGVSAQHEMLGKSMSLVWRGLGSGHLPLTLGSLGGKVKCDSYTNWRVNFNKTSKNAKLIFFFLAQFNYVWLRVISSRSFSTAELTIAYSKCSYWNCHWTAKRTTLFTPRWLLRLRSHHLGVNSENSLAFSWQVWCISCSKHSPLALIEDNLITRLIARVNGIAMIIRTETCDAIFDHKRGASVNVLHQRQTRCSAFIL